MELRKSLLLPLDDLLSVVREFLNPDVSRSGLDRCLRRHGAGNLRPEARHAAARAQALQGQVRSVYFPSQEDATCALLKLEAAKRRRGYWLRLSSWNYSNPPASTRMRLVASLQKPNMMGYILSWSRSTGRMVCASSSSPTITSPPMCMCSEGSVALGSGPIDLCLMA